MLSTMRYKMQLKNLWHISIGCFLLSDLTCDLTCDLMCDLMCDLTCDLTCDSLYDLVDLSL